MSIEVELKLKIRDKAEVSAALKQLGFTWCFSFTTTIMAFLNAQKKRQKR